MSEGTGRDPVEDLLAASIDGVAVLADGVHVRTNDAYAATFGADAGALVDAGWRELFPEGVRERIAAVSGDGDGTTETISGVDCERVDGDPVSVDLRIRGTPRGAVVVVRRRPAPDRPAGDPGSGPRNGGDPGSGTDGGGGDPESGTAGVAGDRRRVTGGGPDHDASADHERLLTALHDAAREIQEARSVETVAERAVEAAHDVLGWPLSACWYHDEGADALEPVAGRGGAGVTTITEGDPEWEVFVAGEPRVVDVGAARPDIPIDVGEGMLFPLGEHGLLGAAVPDERSYAEWEVETMELLAAHAESALARVERERRLQASEQRYRSLVETAPVPVGIVTEDLDVAYCNDAAAEFLGAEDPGAVEGLPVEEIVHGAHRDEGLAAIETTIAEGVVGRPAEWELLTLDGRRRTVIGAVAPVTHEGQPAAQVVLDDVTEGRRTGERYERLVEAAPVPIAIVTADGEMAYCNRATAEFHGVTDPSELVGRTATELMAEDAAVEVARERLRRVIAEGETVHAVERRFRQVGDGPDRVGVASLAPITYRGERAAQVIVNDITERKRRERELEQSERRYRTLAEHFPNGAVGMFDEDLRLTVVGGEVLSETGLSPDEIEGSTVEELLDGPRAAALTDAFEAALEGESRTLDLDLADREWTFHTLPVRDDAGEVFAGMVMSQDVTEHRERERELRRSERRYRVLADRIPDLSVALFEPEGDDLRYTLVAGSTFEGLSIDPADLEGELFTEVHSGEYVETHFRRYRAALDGESRTFEFSFEDRAYEGHVMPFRDEAGEIVSGMAVTRDVTEHRERERELRRRRDELATLNGITELLLNITRALSEAPGRDELEEIVCERLAESDLYRFAWIGERAIDDEEIVVRTSAGVDDGYLEAVTTAAGDVPGDGPGGLALETGEVQVVEDVLNDESFAAWREAADARGIRSAAAVPLVHGETVYGLLAVYSGRPDAFSDREQAAFAILGETIGFVINAIGNRQLLVADTVTELTFEGTEPDELLVDCSQRVGAAVSLEGYTQTDDDVWIVYLSTEGGSPEELAAFLRDRPGIDDAWVIESGEDGGGVGLRDRSPSFLQSVLSAGATLQEAIATEGLLRAVVEVPGSADVRNVVDLLRDEYPSIEFVAQRERDRPVRTVAEFRDGLEAGLTGRQRAALQAAYYAGYFDWPRESTAEDVAESMGISSATLHHHLRKAQHRLLSLFFDEESD